MNIQIAADPLDRHPLFRRLADYLAEKAPPGRLPGRQHIDPVELRDMLPHLLLLDVLRDDEGAQPGFRVRLAGTEVETFHGRGLTGLTADEAFPGPRAEPILASYREIARTGVASFRRSSVLTPGREHLVFERMMFPLARDGASVDMLIGVFVYAIGKRVRGL
jgi:hypothetical protein